ncbi:MULTISPECIES: TVP38/TMEM64 family protein [Paenibacillus]|nr:MULTISPECIES: VTT domain-containing protein [Paenibacillus]
MRPWLAVLVYVMVLGAAFMYRHPILDWLERGHPPLLGLAAAIALALFPIMPYKAVIALFGYAYGSLVGGLLCWLATTVSSTAFYAFARWLLRSRAEAWLEKRPRVQRWSDAARRRPFASLVAARLLPFIPQIAVNVSAGAAGIPFVTFLVASGIGKLPAIAAFALLGGTARQHPGTAAAVLALYAAAAGAVILSLRRQ